LISLIDFLIDSPISPPGGVVNPFTGKPLNPGSQNVDCLRKRRGQLWNLIDEMEAAKVKPNHVTCSILLKSLTQASAANEIDRTMKLVEDMDEDMDEVLLSSVVEACVRINKIPLLVKKLKAIREQPKKIKISGAHTYGSLIKAYGHARDLAGVSQSIS